MADPRQSPVDKRQPKLSPLMAAKAKAPNGEKVNVCPFDANDEHVDEHGYCRHLVGFTNDGKMMEPMAVNAQLKRYTDGSNKVPVKKTDTVIQITTSSRVYRDVKEEAEPAV